MRRVALYVRVSTQEQKNHGLSVDNQIKALEDYCSENNYYIHGLYNDAGISARKSYKKRPALLQLINDCQSGQIDLILFTRLDRWFRSVGDYYEVQKELDACHVPWRAIWEDYETETSAGIFKVNIMLSVAQSEADRTSEKIKSVLDYKKEKGDFLGHPPYGYKIENKKLVYNEAARPAVEAFFKAYLSCFSISKAAAVMRTYGVTLHRDTLSKQLRNPVYSGVNRNGGKCPAYITPEEFEIIQKSFRKKTPNIKKHDYLFTGGLLKCARCGRYMCGSSRRLKVAHGTKDYKFYSCLSYRGFRCDMKETISEKRIERFLLDNLESALDEYNIRIKTIEAERQDISKQVNKLRAKLSRIGERYEDGDITREEYAAKRDTIKRDIYELECKITPIKIKKLPEDWLETYNSLDEPHKRAFWYSIVDKVEFCGGENPLRLFL